MKIKAIVNTKGGVGKSTLAFNVFPIVFPEFKKIYEIDSSNITKLENKEKENKIVAENFDIKKIDIALDKIDMVEMEERDENIIIDTGAGADTKIFLDAISSESFVDSIEFYIPTNDDWEQFQNIVDTIALIRKVSKTAKINLVLNRVHDMLNLEKQFLNLFGSKELGIDSRFEQVQEEISQIHVVPNMQMLGIIKGQYKQFLKDFLETAHSLVDNEQKYKKEWVKEGEETFLKGKKKLRFFKKAIEFEETVRNAFNNE